MSDFGAPLPRRAKRGRRALARVVSREARKKQLGGLGGAVSPPTGFGAEPRKFLGFRCLNGLILCLLVTSNHVTFTICIIIFL